MIKIIPIAETQVNWQQYLTMCETAVGRKISQYLDNKQKGTLAFIATLGELVNANSNANEAISESGFLARHVSLSFLVVTTSDIIYEVSLQGKINILETDTKNREAIIAIASNNLEDWRVAIVNGCSPNATNNVRSFYNKVLHAFDILGYTKVFQAYERKQKNDGTFLLTQR